MQSRRSHTSSPEKRITITPQNHPSGPSIQGFSSKPSLTTLHQNHNVYYTYQNKLCTKTYSTLIINPFELPPYANLYTLQNQLLFYEVLQCLDQRAGVQATQKSHSQLLFRFAQSPPFWRFVHGAVDCDSSQDSLRGVQAGHIAQGELPSQVSIDNTAIGCWTKQVQAIQEVVQEFQAKERQGDDVSGNSG